MRFMFEQFNKVIEKRKVEIVQDQCGQNYVLMVLVNGLPIEQIDFEMFGIEDVAEVLDHLEEAITDENMDGEVAIDPNHPYCQIISLGEKISKMEDVPKIRASSPFSFL